MSAWLLCGTVHARGWWRRSLEKAGQAEVLTPIEGLNTLPSGTVNEDMQQLDNGLLSVKNH